MYLTRIEKRRILKITLAVLAVLILIAIGFLVFPLVSWPEKAEEATIEDAAKETALSSYTQYSKNQNTCIYYYDKSQCYVPLSFCVLDSEVKTPQEIDTEKYCSNTPELEAKTLISPKGSACPFTATEGDLISLKSIVRDPDEEDPNNPIGPLGKLEVYFSSPFEDSNGVWQTKEGDVGIHRFTITVTDGEFTEEKSYCIEVLVANNVPVLSNLNDVSVVAGETVTLNPACTDPDGDAVKISYSGDLSGREWMTDSIKETKEKDVGTHIVTVACIDERGLPAYKSVDITVLPSPPVQESKLSFVGGIDNIRMNEGDTIVLNPKVYTESENPVSIVYSGWMEKNTKTTTYSDAGVYSVTITASDGTATISKSIKIEVINVNRPPEILDTQKE